MTKPVTVFAAVQMSSQGDVDANLASAARLAAQATEQGANVVLLPENFAYMGPDEGKSRIAEPVGGEGPGAIDGPQEDSPILRALARAARANRVHIIAGGMPERSSDPQRPYNTCAVIAPDGSLVAKYRKMHLFDVDVGDGQLYRESAHTTAGTGPACCEIAGFRVGLSVCYDLRFPELYRALSDAGADVLVVPAAFTLATGKDHWHVLLRARAIESQAYVVAAAQWGTHPRGRRTYGKSSIVDPWGDVVAGCSEGEGVVSAAIERSYIEQVRNRLPSLRHRRL